MSYTKTKEEKEIKEWEKQNGTLIRRFAGKEYHKQRKNMAKLKTTDAANDFIMKYVEESGFKEAKQDLAALIWNAQKEALEAADMKDD